MSRWLRLSIFVYLLLMAAWVSPALAEKRVALVIGNSTYEHATPLKNPTNDAKDIAAILRKLGFEVLLGINTDQQQFESKVRDFARIIRNADTALFFYAGHGLQVNGRNYLAPIDTKLDDEADLEFETVRLELILAQMERDQRTNLVFLDACRDNPLARNLARSMGTRSTNVGRGLARVESGVGTLISFATQPGNVALDGAGDNSPFTDSLIRHIETPNLDVALLMRRVREEVISTTNGKQVPWSNSSLIGSFAFHTDASGEAAPVPNSSEKSTELVALQKRLQELENRLETQNESPGARAGSSEIMDPKTLAYALQTELKRVGCDPGAIDGQWGRKGRNALSQFNRYTKLSLPTDEPTSETLDAVKARTGRVCPKNTKPKSASAPPKTKRNSRSGSAAKRVRTCHLGDIEGCRRGCQLGYQRACAALRRLQGR